MRRPATVFLGGGIGACLRALLLAWLAPWGASLPLPVLVANVLGAFALGVVYVLADEAGLLRVETRLFLAAGVLGGFTTFSTFGWGADLLLGSGSDGAALIYLVASVAGGVAAVTAGMAVARLMATRLARTGMRPVGRLTAGGTPRGDARSDIAAVEAEDREDLV